MTSAWSLPDGFELHRRGRTRLMAASRHLAALREAGLDRPEGWRRRLASGERGVSRRGATARVRLEPRFSARLKQLRRGGMLAALWRERFVGVSRLLDNLRLPVEAVRRGLPTPAPVALLLERDAPGLYRGWLAVGDVAGASDLLTFLRVEPSPDARRLAPVLGLVRSMHDAGLEHRDLNLGNLLVRESADGMLEPFVIDLDGSRLHDAPLGFAARQRALRRLERSYVKWLGQSPCAGTMRERLYELYAAGDPELTARLARGRRTGRLRIRAHSMLRGR